MISKLKLIIWLFNFIPKIQHTTPKELIENLNEND